MHDHQQSLTLLIKCFDKAEFHTARFQYIQINIGRIRRFPAFEEGNHALQGVSGIFLSVLEDLFPEITFRTVSHHRADILIIPGEQGLEDLIHHEDCQPGSLRAPAVQDLCLDPQAQDRRVFKSNTDGLAGLITEIVDPSLAGADKFHTVVGGPVSINILADIPPEQIPVQGLCIVAGVFQRPDADLIIAHGIVIRQIPGHALFYNDLAVPDVADVIQITVDRDILITQIIIEEIAFQDRDLPLLLSPLLQDRVGNLIQHSGPDMLVRQGDPCTADKTAFLRYKSTLFPELEAFHNAVDLFRPDDIFQYICQQAQYILTAPAELFVLAHQVFFRNAVVAQLHQHDRHLAGPQGLMEGYKGLEQTAAQKIRAVFVRE